MLYGKRTASMYENNRKEALEFCNDKHRFGIANLNGQRVFIFADMPEGKEMILRLQPGKAFPRKYYYTVQYQNVANPVYVETLKDLAKKGAKHFIAVADIRLVKSEDTQADLLGMLLTWCRTASKESGVEMTDFLYACKGSRGDKVLSNEQLIEMFPPK